MKSKLIIHIKSDAIKILYDYCVSFILYIYLCEIYAQYIHCNGSCDFRGICNNL